MLFAITSLVLSAILMTQADVDDIVSDVTNVKPLSEELYIFDVTSDASIADLKGALKSASVEVRHSFQVLGTHQYFFVVVDDEGDAIRQLTFPKGSVVTQYLVEHGEEYFEMFGLPGPNVSDTAEALDDKDLMVTIREIVFPDVFSTSQLKSMMEAMARAYNKPQEIARAVHYQAIGRYPPKSFVFVNIDENALQKALLNGLDAAGGPGNIVNHVLRLRKV